MSHDGVGLLNVLEARAEYPVKTGKDYRCTDDDAAPVHVLDGRNCNGRIQREAEDCDSEQRPPYRHSVDEVSPAAQIEVRPWRQNVATAKDYHHYGYHIANLEKGAAS